MEGRGGDERKGLRENGLGAALSRRPSSGSGPRLLSGGGDRLWALPSLLAVVLAVRERHGMSGRLCSCFGASLCEREAGREGVGPWGIGGQGGRGWRCCWL